MVFLFRGKHMRSINEIFAKFKEEQVTPEEFLAIVEITKGDKTKYELDKDTGFLRLDRILSTSTHYPHSYGFIPLTHCEDGDPLDVLILCSEPIVPLTIVKCRPIGVMRMIDNGKPDPKIIAIAVNDPNYNVYHSSEELPTHVLDEIKHFFDVYKNLENMKVLTGKVERADAARQEVQHCIDLYKKLKK